MATDEIEFVGRVLDNVHGFIYYTSAEEKIMNTLLFKRLQSIKQLSIVNWVFPGSEHTRYIHSLGVMYIADKIAMRLELSMEERKIVRLAGLLHDIGHYPLSHVCEFPYKKNLESFPDDSFCRQINKKVLNQIDTLGEEENSQYMEQSMGCHHEKIGAHIVCNNEEIHEIIVEECGPKAPDIIADMITGNIERKDTDSLLVQILHSELDADGIDYLMRDAMFSGTSFGAFELDQLIGCMEVGEYEGKKILCINPKGIAAADQYLLNKFFSYSQVVFNKHIGITEWMAEQIVNWMQKNSAFFPDKKELEKLVKSSEPLKKYVGFTDNFFWSSLQNILDNPLKNTEPKIIKFFSEKLLNHSELQYEPKSEVKIISNDVNEIKNTLFNSETYKRLANYSTKIALFSERKMSKQIREEKYEEILKTLTEKGNENPEAEDSVTKEDLAFLKARRYMECITVKENGKLRLLCDDNRSLMRTLYDVRLVLLRVFDCDTTNT
ncbi:HD domain-containing protein [Eubacterium ventriosum]|uniref:HD domain-containing protein n=1 Tax=Eubacterium ventriosum TaxID=39496 RepID=UPI000E4C8FEC|nr:HD domain-containing protein [Eubacterium ventriosum]RHD19006.1 HD domain-containing protein [Eubacterium ventriosum]